MTRPLLLLFPTLLIVISSTAQVQDCKYAFQKFSPDSVKAVIDDWTRELSKKHPGFYRYNSKEAFSKYIDSVKNTIQDSLTELQSYLKLKPIISKVHCLHTGVTLPKEYTNYLNQQPNLFPFQLYFDRGKAYVVKNYSSVGSILEGDELVSINGKNIHNIITQLLPLIPADGYNETMKYRALYYQFPTWYRLIDLTENFTTVVKQTNGEAAYEVKGAKYDDIVRDGFLREPKLAKQLEFTIQDNIGFLTIHTFSNSSIKKSGQEFRNFIDNAFLQLKTGNIKDLIVDLRDNTGGSDAHAAYFTRYFFDEPFRYWDRIEVTEAIAKEIKGVTLKLFYRKPIQKDSVWLWQKARHARDFDFYEEQKPAKNNFKGKTYILINGFCMSSCADVAAILSYNKKAIFIGQETGGGYQGNNSGMMPEAKMLPFDFTLSVPLQKYFNYVDTSRNIGRGTMPDHPVNFTINDILKGGDKELQFAIALVQNSSR